MKGTKTTDAPAGMAGLLDQLATSLRTLHSQAAAKTTFIRHAANREYNGERMTLADLKNIQDGMYEVERAMLRCESDIAAVEEKAVTMGAEPMPEPVAATARKASAA